MDGGLYLCLDFPKVQDAQLRQRVDDILPVVCLPAARVVQEGERPQVLQRGQRRQLPNVGQLSAGSAMRWLAC